MFSRLRKHDAQLNVYNLGIMRQQRPQRFHFLRVDSNNDCNVHCVYCHNHRSADRIDVADLRAFLEQNVISTDNFQLGCVMEPTLDPRMGDLMLLVAGSRAKPAHRFVLQTNGLLLHRHDHAKMRDAGLTRLSVSIDSADPATHKLLRGGSSLSKAIANVAVFRESCPAAEVEFITTVTRANVDGVDSLVALGLDLGVSGFVLRAVFYLPENNVVDHARMPQLLLEPHDFARMRDRLVVRFGRRARFEFADGVTLDRRAQRMKADSFR